MADWTIVQGDTSPAFFDELTYANGNPVDLTGATVRFIMRSLTSNEPVALTGSAAVQTPKAGTVAFIPSTADTANPGNFMANWLVTGGTVGRMTFPTKGYLWVQVQENLTAVGGAQIVSLPEVKEQLRIPANDRVNDEMLTECIEAVGPLIENLTGPILVRTFDEWYEGGHATISLRHKPAYGYGTTPVLNVLAVSEYRGPIEYALAVVGTPAQGQVYSVEANLELGILARRTSGGGTTQFWRDPNHPQQSIHVVYQAGQEKVPTNVRRAAVETIRWWWQTTEAVGRGGLTRADEEIPRPMVALPYHAEAMLAPTARPPAFA